MLVDVNQSIAAIASPPGFAPRSVIRLSGPQITHALSQCFDPGDGSQLESVRGPQVIAGEFRAGAPLGRIPIELYYWPTKASYTRQRSAEIHVVGAVPIVNEIMRTLQEHGVRQAQPGEFTLRAFLAGRIDLTRAEAVLGVIDAASVQEMNVALQQLSGGLAGPVQSVHESLIDLLAQIEAGLDFAEEDIEFISRSQVADVLRQAGRVLHEIVSQITGRELGQTQFRVVLFGKPNAGKSCLLNALTDRETALVSDIAGTTRDYVMGVIENRGLTIQLIDTAGLGRPRAGSQTNAGDAGIQAEAQALSRDLVSSAHLKLLCVDGSQQPGTWENDQFGNLNSSTVLVKTKCDLPTVWTHPQEHAVSSVSGQGVAELENLIFQKVAHSPSTSEMIASTASRCYESLVRSLSDLRAAEQLAVAGGGDEILAAQIRNILAELSIVTGQVYTDDILDRIFRQFCIGK